MNYSSTRCDKKIEDSAAMLLGLAEDGAMYIDDTLTGREFDWRAVMEKSSAEIASAVVSHMLPGISGAGEKAKALFCNDISTVKASEDIYMVQSSSGAAALRAQLLPSLASEAEAAGSRTVFLSLNTGISSLPACEGFRASAGTELIVFCPEDNMSSEEKALMESAGGDNVRIVFVKGGYDECSKALRLAREALYADGMLRDKSISLSSVGSGNIVNVAVNTACCFIVYASLVKSGQIKAGDELSFSLPANDLGAAMACLYAKKMGLPVESVICASNANRCLTEFIKTGVFDKNRRAVKTMCPAMDLLVPAGLERLVYCASEGDRKYTESNMKSFFQWGTLRLSLDTLLTLQEDFEAYSFEDDKISAAMDKLKESCSADVSALSALAYLAAQASKDSFMGCDSPVAVLSPSSCHKETGTEQSEGTLIEKGGIEAYLRNYLG